MNLSLYTLKDYFAYMDRIHAKGGKPIVAAETFKMRRDEMGGVTDIRVVSGFPFEEHYYELTIECDEILAGDKDPAGLKQASEVIESIRDKCQTLGFGFGGGRWQP